MEKTSKCDNNYKNCLNSIIKPQCWNNNAEEIVTIKHSELSSETDVLKLCQSCKEAVVKDARKRNYVVSVRPLIPF